VVHHTPLLRPRLSQDVHQPPITASNVAANRHKRDNGSIHEPPLTRAVLSDRDATVRTCSWYRLGVHACRWVARIAWAKAPGRGKTFCGQLSRCWSESK